MGDTKPTDGDQSGKAATDLARGGVKQAEAGAQSGAEQVERAEATDPDAARAAEQEAAEGPDGRGLSR